MAPLAKATRALRKPRHECHKVEAERPLALAWTPVSLHSPVGGGAVAILAIHAYHISGQSAGLWRGWFWRGGGASGRIFSS